MTKFRVPGNTQQKETEKSRLDCFWGIIPLKNRQEIFDAFDNKKDFKEIENMPKDKIFIYKNEVTALTKESVSWLLKDMQKCLKKKLALLEKT